MANAIFYDAYVAIGGTDVSDYVKSVTLNITKETQDDTAMGDTTRSAKAGLSVWSGSIEFNQDFADNLIDEIIWTIFSAGTVTTIEVRPTSSSRGASNPGYNGNAIITEYTPLTGAVGDLATASLSFTASKGSGSAAISRSTS